LACYESGNGRTRSANAEPIGHIIIAVKGGSQGGYDMAHFGPTRRSLLQGTLAASALSLTGFPARAEPQWKKYAGTTIEANLIKGPRGELLQKYAGEFTELTGIKVGSEVIPEQQQRQKAVIELASGRPSFDVVHVSYHVQKRQFEKAGWLADVSGFMKDPNLTAPDLTESDFSAAGLQFAKPDNGPMHSLPWSVDYFILYYNKEIFAKKGVAVPKTFDEMVAAAETLTDAKEGVYGFVGRGLRNANMTLWTNFFLNYGGEFLDAKGNILTDGPEAIEATKLYQRLLTKVAPPGVAGFNWMESMAAFTQGRAAMWIDGVGWAPPLEDPNASRIVGKVGYTLVPAGPKGQYSATYGDGIGIAQASKNKEAAWLYCQWAVSKLMGARLLQSGGGVPFRNSVLNDENVRKGVKMPPEWLDSVIGSAKISKLGLPVVIPVAEFRDLVGAAITATLSGADPATELKKANDQFRPILERSEKA
jgi:multiple sugar transport system substrate-binding protein